MTNCDELIDLQQKITLYDDESAYSDLFRLCFPLLMRFAYSFVKSRELSEEIAADVLIRVWSKRKHLDKVKNFRLYLYVSTRNAALNCLKKQRREMLFVLDEAAIWLKADDSTPEQLFITTELLKKIQEAIRRLPPQCRLIYKLIKEDSLKYKETAELLHLSIKTIEAQMGIAMKRLYQVFQNYMQEPMPVGEEIKDKSIK